MGSERWKKYLLELLLKSKGIKRKLAAFVATLIEVAKTVPELAVFLPLLQNLAAILGGVGLAHGVKNTEGLKLVSISALLSVLVASAPYVPQLAPWLPLIQTLAAILGAVGLGTTLKK